MGLAETLFAFITKDMAIAPMSSLYLGMVCGSRKISKGYAKSIDSFYQKIAEPHPGLQGPWVETRLNSLRA